MPPSVAFSDTFPEGDGRRYIFHRTYNDGDGKKVSQSQKFPKGKALPAVLSIPTVSKKFFCKKTYKNKIPDLNEYLVCFIASFYAFYLTQKYPVAVFSGGIFAFLFISLCRVVNYLTIFATTPDPTVLPPSRIAKRRPSSHAIGVISTTSIVTWSPGITISTPSGSLMVPVTSVVLK